MLSAAVRGLYVPGGCSEQLFGGRYVPGAGCSEQRCWPSRLHLKVTHVQPVRAPGPRGQVLAPDGLPYSRLLVFLRFNFKEETPTTNFDTFPAAILTVFQVRPQPRPLCPARLSWGWEGRPCPSSGLCNPDSPPQPTLRTRRGAGPQGPCPVMPPGSSTVISQPQGPGTPQLFTL